MENETIYADGFWFDKPREGAPDFVKGKMSIQADKAVAFIEKHKNEKGYVNLDLLKGKEKGNLYFKLNTWKPEGMTPKPPEAETEEISPDEIPF